MECNTTPEYFQESWAKDCLQRYFVVEGDVEEAQSRLADIESYTREKALARLLYVVAAILNDRTGE